MSLDKIASAMFEAMSQDIGVVVETDDVEAWRAKAYKVRKEQAPTFDALSFITSPTNPAQIWIVKKNGS